MTGCIPQCLQHEPHYIAAGSIFLAAKIWKVNLPKEKGKVWWLQFDVSPKHLEEVAQQMMGLLEHNRIRAQPVTRGKGTALKPIAGTALSKYVAHSQSCTLSGSVAPVCGIFTAKVNAEGPDDSVSSKCEEKQVCSDVPDTLKPIAGKALSGSPQTSTPSGSVVALDWMTKAEGICDSVSSKCNEPQACSDVQDTLKETRLHCQTSDSSSADSIVED